MKEEVLRIQIFGPGSNHYFLPHNFFILKFKERLLKFKPQNNATKRIRAF